MCVYIHALLPPHSPHPPQRPAHLHPRPPQDASYLLELVLDALVDDVFPVVDAYSSLIEEYEAKVLGGKPGELGGGVGSVGGSP